MANLEKSPSLSAKLKTKDAANKIKHGSPKLQEVLRQRCRQRMKEKRGQLFDRRRQGLMMETDEDVHETLTEIIRTELSQLATWDIDAKNSLLEYGHDGALTEEEAFALENEILVEEEQWILAEYEKLQRDEAEMLALFAEDCLRETVICPLCEKGIITETRDALTCTVCDLSLPPRMGVEDFGKILQNRIASHSMICGGRPCFMVLPENNTESLYITCETCPTFCLII